MAVANTNPATSTTGIRRMLVDKAVAERLNCSVRHVHRLVDLGLLPAGLKLGGLRRWDADALEAWIAKGCPPVRGR
jgi:excisionase family DNA binding protein